MWTFAETTLVFNGIIWQYYFHISLLIGFYFRKEIKTIIFVLQKLFEWKVFSLLFRDDVIRRRLECFGGVQEYQLRINMKIMASILRNLLAGWIPPSWTTVKMSISIITVSFEMIPIFYSEKVHSRVRQLLSIKPSQISNNWVIYMNVM